MARRRFRARVNWAVRWGGIAAVLGIAAVYAATWRRGPVATRKGTSPSAVIQVWRGQVHVVLVTAEPSRCVTFAFPGGSPQAAWDLEIRERLESWAAAPSPFGMRSQNLDFLPICTVREAFVPLWPVAALVVPLSVFAWRTRPPVCDYDLSGLPAGSLCPECGV
jgi:hypothetical protein